MKFVSVMGDSISTFPGAVPAGYSVYYDEDTCVLNGITSVYDLWWAKVNQGLHACICVDNAYSGSMVTDDRFPSAGSTERTSLLHTPEHSPDIILVYMGFNDFGNGKRIVGESLHSYPGFYEGYLDMLQKIRKNYPEASVVCGTLMKTVISGQEDWVFPKNGKGVSIDEYNVAIRIAARTAGVSLADLAALGRRYETLDGTHPTREGHRMLAEAWLECLHHVYDRKVRDRLFGEENP